MTKKQLVELLQDLPDDIELYKVDYNDYDDGPEISALDLPSVRIFIKTDAWSSTKEVVLFTERSERTIENFVEKSLYEKRARETAQMNEALRGSDFAVKITTYSSYISCPNLFNTGDDSYPFRVREDGLIQVSLGDEKERNKYFPIKDLLKELTERREKLKEWYRSKLQ